MTTDELVRQYDETAQQTVVGLDFVREEIVRRETHAATQAMVRMTHQMKVMTVLITVLTAINAFAAVIPIFWKAGS
jgi:hypothetical protein